MEKKFFSKYLSEEKYATYDVPVYDGTESYSANNQVQRLHFLHSHTEQDHTHTLLNCHTPGLV